MITITSHVLDGETGDHAAGISVTCSALHSDSRRIELFAVQADTSGRISESVPYEEGWNTLELVFHSGSYLGKRSGSGGAGAVREVVIRLSVDNPESSFHVPVIISSHSYSTWWSS